VRVFLIVVDKRISATAVFVFNAESAAAEGHKKTPVGQGFFQI
jgi:hypothetical protein